VTFAEVQKLVSHVQYQVSCCADYFQGDVVAIIGPSGSGKSTLLNTLAQRPAAAKAKVQSNIQINGSEVSSTNLRKLARYVEQEDCLIGSLTARETLNFAAKLGLPRYVAR
jgi:ABC-type multidrug transport system ATPase subunit